MGAWILYGLGSESENLPGFVVLSSGVGTSGGESNWSSGFLPSTYQGVQFRSSGDPVLYLSNPPERQPGNAARRSRCPAGSERGALRERRGDVEIASRIASYELAFRMQMAAPELLDFSKESAEHARDVRREQGADASVRAPIACWRAAWWSAACAS